MVARVESADERAALELSKVEDDDVGVLGVGGGATSSDNNKPGFKLKAIFSFIRVETLKPGCFQAFRVDLAPPHLGHVVDDVAGV